MGFQSWSNDSRSCETQSLSIQDPDSTTQDPAKNSHFLDNWRDLTRHFLYRAYDLHVQCAKMECAGDKQHCSMVLSCFPCSCGDFLCCSLTWQLSCTRSSSSPTTKQTCTGTCKQAKMTSHKNSCALHLTFSRSVIVFVQLKRLLLEKAK